MKKQVRKRLLITLIVLIILVVFSIFYIQTKKISEDNKFCLTDSDCKIQPTVCGCYAALNKNFPSNKGVSMDIDCKVKITKLFEENESEMEDDSCSWKLETTAVKCIRNQCTLVEVEK